MASGRTRIWSATNASRMAGGRSLEHECMAEAVVIAAAAPDCGEISSGQREMTHQLTLLRRWVKQLCDLGFAQSLSSCHSCLLDLDADRPSDPGQGVDQRAGLDAEGATDRGLGGAAVEGRDPRPGLLGFDGAGPAPPPAPPAGRRKP